MLISMLIFLAGLIYSVLGIWVLYRIDVATNGRGLGWVAGILLLEILTLMLWPLALLAHGLDCALQRLLRLTVRPR